MQYGCNSFLGFPGVMLAAQIHHLREANVTAQSGGKNKVLGTLLRAAHAGAVHTDPPYGNWVAPDQCLIAARLLITCG